MTKPPTTPITTLHWGILPLATPEILALPGQDPLEFAMLHDRLYQECKPRNIIEGAWLYDLAVMMGRIAYLRQARQSLHLANQRKLAKAILDPLPGSEEELRRSLQHIAGAKRPQYSPEELEKLRQKMERGFSYDANDPGDENAIHHNLIGSDLQENFAIYAQFDALEQNLLRERDRIIAQFDRRRREELAGKVLEIETLTAVPTEVLPGS